MTACEPGHVGAFMVWDDRGQVWSGSSLEEAIAVAEQDPDERYVACGLCGETVYE